MSKNKKSGLFVELMANYGFAITATLIIIAGLVYFGVLEPYHFLGDRPPEIEGLIFVEQSMEFLSDYNLSVAKFTFVIQNSALKNLYNLKVTINECEDNTGKSSSPVMIGKEQSKMITISCSDIIGVLGKKTKYHMSVFYNTHPDEGGVEHKEEGYFITSPIELVDYPDNKIGRRIWALGKGASGRNDANRFYPTFPVSKDISIYGGYVDSMTGIVWQEEDASSNFTWATREFLWDGDQPEWNSKRGVYEYSGDDTLGFAFRYCETLIINGFSDWKLPSMENLMPISQGCSACFPPSSDHEGYQYWTDEGSLTRPELALYINIKDFGSMSAEGNKDTFRKTRCVRDAP